MAHAEAVATKFFDKLRSLFSRKRQAHDPTETLIPSQGLSVIKKLSQAKFAVYLAVSKIDDQKFAMKVFFDVDDAPHHNFKNEIRFSSLKHPNVIDMSLYQENAEIVYQGEMKKGSYILMEYAPYGDLFDFIIDHKDQIDEKLVRTLFRELIEGIEYLHQNGVAHLDLKPENLLIGEDFRLKIADFDISFIKGDEKVISKGTPCYRAPEMRCPEPKFEALMAADIYSAGIILFIMKSGGLYPHSENDSEDDENMEELMYNDNRKFWELHCLVEGKSHAYDKYFRELFNNMVKFNPAERLTISQIKESKWYKDSVYSPKDFHSKMEKIVHH